MATKNTNWLDRHIAAPGPYLALCLSEDEFIAAAAHLGVPVQGTSWVSSPQSNATTHPMTSTRGELAAIVCMRVDSERSGVEIAGLLVHEAVHVWQEYASFYGENAPGAEQEAYAIQAVAQVLMEEYARRTVG